MEVQGHADGHVGPDERPHPGRNLAIGVGVLLGYGRAVLGKQNAVPGPALPQQLQHLADDAVEGVLRDRPDGSGMGIYERRQLEAKGLSSLDESRDRVVGVAVLAHDLVASHDPGSLELLVGRGHPGEGVGLVCDAHKRDSHASFLRSPG